MIALGRSGAWPLWRNSFREMTDSFVRRKLKQKKDSRMNSCREMTYLKVKTQN
ncbi:hypothetical protein DPMN_082602 [Dreissena polymorpha]|uniref:Uncharacterized protein n=1 Tax=Dreissena polymorpha TaxID=45954 RepID=A0A9D3Y9J7_DREPO|nr:hypothetical protein DPMN_082602 [Dreissena polymorpha]